MMRLLLDLTSVSGGGGLEQSSALLDAFEAQDSAVSIVCIMRKNSSLVDLFSSSRFDIVTIKPGLVSRAWHYLFGLGLLARQYGADLIYIPFGIGGLSWGACPQVINVAYPIICYPDSPFWRHLPTLARLRTKAKCLFRRLSIRWNADAVIVESDRMASRLVRHASFAQKSLSIIPPVVGRTAASFARRVSASMPPSGSGDTVDKPCRLLFITNAAQHKNIWRLGEVAETLARASRPAVLFVLTVNITDYVECCRKAGVDDHLSRHSEHFLFLGALHGADLIQQIEAADAIVNISDLESVSNNFVEAAFAGKPMIIARRDFALDSVRTPFVVCEPHEPASFVRAMDNFRANVFDRPSLKQAVAISGKEKGVRLAELFRQKTHRVS